MIAGTFPALRIALDAVVPAFARGSAFSVTVLASAL